MSKWNPNDHLPECGVTRYPICICDRLRACEERKDAEWQRALNADLQYAVGYSDALDAARDAVAAEMTRNGWDETTVACTLAAIDALREEQK